jgi:hypothetical protein
VLVRRLTDDCSCYHPVACVKRPRQRQRQRHVCVIVSAVVAAFADVLAVANVICSHVNEQKPDTPRGGWRHCRGVVPFAEGSGGEPGPVLDGYRVWSPNRNVADALFPVAPFGQQTRTSERLIENT